MWRPDEHYRPTAILARPGAVAYRSPVQGFVDPPLLQRPHHRARTIAPAPNLVRGLQVSSGFTQLTNDILNLEKILSFCIALWLLLDPLLIPEPLGYRRFPVRQLLD